MTIEECIKERELFECCIRHQKNSLCNIIDFSDIVSTIKDYNGENSYFYGYKRSFGRGGGIIIASNIDFTKENIPFEYCKEIDDELNEENNGITTTAFIAFKNFDPIFKNSHIKNIKTAKYIYSLILSSITFPEEISNKKSMKCFVKGFDKNFNLILDI